MATDLRCEGDQLFGILSDDHKTIEVRCRRRSCGYKPGVVVLHTLSIETGQVTNTKRYRSPQVERNER